MFDNFIIAADILRAGRANVPLSSILAKYGCQVTIAAKNLFVTLWIAETIYTCIHLTCFSEGNTVPAKALHIYPSCAKSLQSINA